MFDCKSMKTKIESVLQGSNANVFSLRNDNEHFGVEVIWSGFSNMKLIERHRKIYGILEDELKQGIHSISIKSVREK